MMFRRQSLVSVLSLMVSTSLFHQSLAAKLQKSRKSTKTKTTKSTKRSKNSKSSKATTIRLSPGQSIQDALDNACDNTIIRLSPGDYFEEDNDNSNSDYGLRISNNKIKLIGSSTRSSIAKGISVIRTRILPRRGIDGSSEQKVGVYVAPTGCEYKDDVCDNAFLSDFLIQDIIVEGFPENGIQTRFVDGFRFKNCQSINNSNNGLYPTLSRNGIVESCVSKGSLDAGLWIAGSRNVAVLNNIISESVTGIEVTVSRDLLVANNVVFNNVVGIGMYHANMAGTKPDFPPYSNWVFENNSVMDNNRVNNAPEGSFQSGLPSGIGIIMAGIRGETVRNNVVEGHNAAGFVMIGFCTIQQLIFQVDCEGPNAPRDNDPSANNNTIIGNEFSRNGNVGFPSLGVPGTDISYFQTQAEFLLQPNTNCFQNNTTPDGTFSTENFVTQIPLPIGGCLND